MKEKGAAIVVTYNRMEKLAICLKKLLEQTYNLDSIYVVNNASTDETESFLEQFCREHSSVKYMTTGENLGGSGGFYIGIKWAYDEGADWIWGMDDDAFPNNDALEEIIKQRNKIEKQGLSNCYWSNCNGDKDFKEDLKIVNTWMFVGFFLPREVISKVGNCRKDFFIYHDDAEYASRIIRQGYNIYKVKNSIINHTDAVLNTRKVKIGNNYITITLVPSAKWKTYYFIRNGILMCNNKKNREKYIRRAIRHLIKAVIWDQKQLKYIWLGLIDGLRGKSGKRFLP